MSYYGTSKESSGSTPSESSGSPCCNPELVTLVGMNGGGSTIEADFTRMPDCTYLHTGGDASAATLAWNAGLGEWHCSLSGEIASVAHFSTGHLDNDDECDPIGIYAVYEDPEEGVFISLIAQPT